MLLVTKLLLYCHTIVSCQFSDDLVTTIYRLLLVIQLALYCNTLFHHLIGGGNPCSRAMPPSLPRGPP